MAGKKKIIPMEIVARKRLKPPVGMSASEQHVWKEMVNSCDAEHFIDSDIPLMVGFCQVFVQQQRAMEQMKNQPFFIMSDNGKVAAHPIVGVHKSLSGTLSNYAMRLRLSPSTRIQQTNKASGSSLPPGREDEGDDIDRMFN